MSDTEVQKEKHTSIFRLILGLLGLALLIFLGIRFGGELPRLAQQIEHFGIWAPILFGIGYAVAVVAFVPGSILTLTAGALFGLLQGTLIVFISASVGCALAFLVSRYLVRGSIERMLERHEKFSAIDEAVGKQGFKIVFLLRLSPAIPFSLLNYALGLTRVRFLDYCLACIGMLPGTFLYIYYGNVIGDVAALAGGNRPARGMADYALLGIGLIATLAVTTLITRIARRALQEVTGEEAHENLG